MSYQKWLNQQKRLSDLFKGHKHELTDPFNADQANTSPQVSNLRQQIKINKLIK